METDMMLSVVARIKEYMSYLGLSLTQFADASEIDRSSMSQILSGRNKKISIGTIAKIHSTYPSLSIPWLLYGEGQMILDGDEFPSGKEPSSIPAEGAVLSLFGDENDINVSRRPDEQKYPKENRSKNDAQSNQPSEKESITDKNVPSEKERKSCPNRRLVKIMLLYSDNTFDAFSPEEAGGF